ncbi:Transthyretin-like family protein [Cooperia oncophora]
MQLLLLLCLVSLSQALLGVGRTQSVAVTGRLICNGQPASNVKVKLYEKESTMDVNMAEGVTDQNGMFRLSGSKTEISTIDPKLNVYHKVSATVNLASQSQTISLRLAQILRKFSTSEPSISPTDSPVKQPTA